MKTLIFVISILISPTLFASPNITISCAEYGSDPYIYAATIKDNVFHFNENHDGKIVKGKYKVLSVERKGSYLKVITKDEGYNSTTQSVYELNGQVLKMHFVSTSNGEIIYSGGGEMSNACVIF